MKRTTALIASLLLSSAAFCQSAFVAPVFYQPKDSIDVTKYSVGYRFTTRTTDRYGNAVTDTLHTILQVGGKVAKTMGYYTCKYELARRPYSKKDNDEFVSRYEWDETCKENTAHYPTVLHDIKKKEMEVQQDVPVHRYAYTEPARIQWTLLKETATIGEYRCQKAKAEYAGRTWYAYYTKKIPSSFGPWKLHGLPGLIVRAEDADGIFCFEMFDYRKGAEAITSHGEENVIKTSHEEFVAMRNSRFLDDRYIDDPLYYDDNEDNFKMYMVHYTQKDVNPSVTVDGVTYSSGISGKLVTMIMGGTVVPEKLTEHRYQPLELK